MTQHTTATHEPFNFDVQPPGEAVRSSAIMAKICARVILENPGISRAAVADTIKSRLSQGGSDFDRHQNTVTRWLDRAVKAGWIDRQGDYSAARYFATPGLRTAWAMSELRKPLHVRKRCGYERKFLDAYEPNVTYYLPGSRLKSMERACPIGSAYVGEIGAHSISTFLCDLTHWSSHLEGSQYEYADTIRLLQDGIQATRARPRDATIIKNHHDATRYVINGSPQTKGALHGKEGFISIRQIDLRSVNALLSDGLLEDDADCGRIRQKRIGVYESAYVPLENSFVIEETLDEVLRKASLINNPWEAAFFLSIHIPYLQPFVDVNKRTARVFCNVPLFRAGVMPMTWTEVPRTSYLDAMAAIYEFNDVGTLAEFFYESYMRSHERLTIQLRQRQPSELQMKFRDELRLAVRMKVMSDADEIPSHLPTEMYDEFMRYVESQIAAISNNPVSGARFGLSIADIQNYFLKNRATNGAEDEPMLLNTQRMRG